MITLLIALIEARNTHWEVRDLYIGAFFLDIVLIGALYF